MKFPGEITFVTLKISKCQRYGCKFPSVRGMDVNHKCAKTTSMEEYMEDIIN